ncbi:MAG: hypothetical protein IJZ86_10330, partial [Bacteroides sp.]|nr:hypothetical protein [Bacteroides sp.]
CFMLHLTYIFCCTKVLMFDEMHDMQIGEYLCFTYQIVAFFSGSKKSHEFGTIEIPESASFAQYKQKENR